MGSPWKSRRINEEVLGNKRAEYGKQIVETLALQLVEEFGPTWNAKQLRRMDAVCLGICRCGDCRIADTTIKVVGTCLSADVTSGATGCR